MDVLYQAAEELKLKMATKNKYDIEESGWYEENKLWELWRNAVSVCK